jgi:hypothetical protein
MMQFVVGRRIMKLAAIVLGILATVSSSFLPCHAQQVNAALTSEQRPGLAASAIPGRVSREQVRAILAAADEESRQALSDLVQQTAALPKTLLSIQDQARSWGKGSTPCLQKISSFQGRLGKSLQPKQVEDIEAMNQLLSRTVDGEVNYCRGQLQSLTNTDCFAVFTSVGAAVDAEKQRQEQIQATKKEIVDVEAALDGGDLSRASQLYQGLSTEAPLPHFAQNYLQQTQSLGLDLANYAQAAQFDHRRTVPLLQQVLTLGREVNMLSAIESGRALTKKYLQDAIKGDTEAVRVELASLPTFQFDETSYQIPGTLSDNDKLAFVSSRIKDIDSSLAAVSATRAMVAQPDAVKTVVAVVGGNEAAKLSATAAQIAAADRVRASLVDAQNSVQAKIAADNEARERRIAAAKEAEAKARAEAQAKAARAARAKQQAEAQARAAARPAQGTANQASMTLEDQDAEDTPDKLAMTADANGGHQYDAFTVVGIKITAARSVEGDHLAPPEAAATQLLGYKLALACMPKLDGQMVPDTFGKPTRAVCASYENLGAGQISGIVAIYHRTMTSGPMKGIQVMKVWITKDGKHFYGPYGVMAAEKPGNDN